jgi:hypothetical protein
VAVFPTDISSTVPTPAAHLLFAGEAIPPVVQVFLDLADCVGDPLGQRLASSEQNDGLDPVLSSWSRASRDLLEVPLARPSGNEEVVPGLAALDAYFVQPLGDRSAIAEWDSCRQVKELGNSFLKAATV